MSLLDSVVDGSQMMELLPLTSAELNTSAYSPDASLLNQHRPQPSKASVMEPPDPDSAKPIARVPTQEFRGDDDEQNEFAPTTGYLDDVALRDDTQLPSPAGGASRVNPPGFRQIRRRIVAVHEPHPGNVHATALDKSGLVASYDKIEAFVEGEEADGRVTYVDREDSHELSAALQQRRVSMRHTSDSPSADHSIGMPSDGALQGTVADAAEPAVTRGESNTATEAAWTYNNTELGKALFAIRMPRTKGVLGTSNGIWAVVWRHAIARVRLTGRAGRVLSWFREASEYGARRRGVAMAETYARARCEAVFDFEIGHLYALCEGYQLREAFERGMIVNLHRTRLPPIGTHEAGMLAVDVSCRRSLHDSNSRTLVEGGAYCKVRRGEYLQQTGRESTEMFDFDVPVHDATEPVTVEVWAADPRGGDTVVGAFQLQPSGLPRSGRGTVSLTLAWNFTPTTQPGIRLSKKELLRYHQSSQFVRGEVMADYRKASSTIINHERYAWQAIVNAFAIEERLLEQHHRRAFTRDVEAFLLAEASWRTDLIREFRRDRLALEEYMYRALMDATESMGRSDLAHAILDRLDRCQRRADREFRLKHGLVRQGTVALWEGCEHYDAAVDASPTPQELPQQQQIPATAFEPHSPEFQSPNRYARSSRLPSAGAVLHRELQDVHAGTAPSRAPIKQVARNAKSASDLLSLTFVPNGRDDTVPDVTNDYSKPPRQGMRHRARSHGESARPAVLGDLAPTSPPSEATGAPRLQLTSPGGEPGSRRASAARVELPVAMTSDDDDVTDDECADTWRSTGSFLPQIGSSSIASPPASVRQNSTRSAELTATLDSPFMTHIVPPRQPLVRELQPPMPPTGAHPRPC
jgi:hypothetical protein